MSSSVNQDDQDQQLRDDIRLLGALLGEIIAEQQGLPVFNAIEEVRQLSVQYRRFDDKAARAKLEARLEALSQDETISLRIHLWLVQRKPLVHIFVLVAPNRLP